MGFGVFVGACMVTGNIKDGFINLLSVYILGALADEGHGYVYLFTFFLAGVVALMEKSGGLAGFAKALEPYAKTAKSGQLLAFAAGLVIFFDDYANTLVVGSMFRPITDSLSVSCEKLAFLVDATAAPIASIVPISSWIGFEVGLIQAELDKIVASNGGVAPAGFPTSGMDVFLQTIEYRYYPIFMLFFIPIMTLAARDFGPMLIAERKVQVYGRKDGGDGSQEDVGDLDDGGNSPDEGTPLRWYNMIVPLVLLIFFIFYMLVATGTTGEPGQTFSDKIQNADSYLGLLVATMATALCMLPFYYVQLIQDGKGVKPTPEVLKTMWSEYRQPTEGASPIKPLMNLHGFVESFILGMSRIFEALIVLTLAWAVGHVMGDVGADRMFSLLIVGGGIGPEVLPTLTYIISAFMALATGTSWGTMTIMFPLITGPTYKAADGNLIIFYATIAGILSGAILGDHISPISDTTVLSSLASRCQLMRHVATQAPYAMVPGAFAIVWGTLPVAFGAYSNGVAIFLGFLTMLAITFLAGVKVINESGKFDMFTELIMKFNKESELHEIKSDTKQAYARLGIEEYTFMEYVKNPKLLFISKATAVEHGVDIDKPLDKSDEDDSDDLKGETDDLKETA